MYFVKPPVIRNVRVAIVRGVGCIFTEMVSGTATFPGTKDAWDQLDRIWQVKLLTWLADECTIISYMLAYRNRDVFTVCIGIVLVLWKDYAGSRLQLDRFTCSEATVESILHRSMLCLWNKQTGCLEQPLGLETNDEMLIIGKGLLLLDHCKQTFYFILFSFSSGT